MKRSGFTMIELIFVIVILGILAAVALPKFIGVSEQAQVGKLKAYVGTLNRTVAPSLWSNAISNGDGGRVKPDATTVYNAELNSSLAPLENITDTGASFPNLALENCLDANTSSVPALNAADTNITAAGGVVASGSVGGALHYVKCVDGNMTSAPQFWLTDGATVLVK